MKRAQYVLNKSIIISIPLAKIIIQVARQNWRIIIIFFIFSSLIYWMIGGVIPLVISFILLASKYK